MRLRSLLIAVGLVSFATTELAAQTCVGAASYASGPVRLGGGYASTDGTKSYGLTLGVGAKAGPFASASVSRSEYSDLDAHGTGVALGAGYAFDLKPTRTVQFCPLASLARESGPDVDYGGSTIALSVRDVGIGGSFGGVVPVTPTLDLVPFAGAYFVASRFSATFQGDTQSDSQNAGEADVGAGFVINRTLTLQPSVAIPFGTDGAKSVLRLALAFNFGGSPKH